ncbi:hypothetical protein [Pelagicoccus sp. SDUM812003]|uniref:hypothetical protein n=1 Tax=Pelagicoccus sp. SDUM812003 TaxID=3041267 RepID=UPI00280C55EE|nr:hypothetical protein [Pelagicoccus sp. SDUM812003]MDQ8203516.1 hypothetical protein [Pelagicoccus sp. SDUM812003]
MNKPSRWTRLVCIFVGCLLCAGLSLRIALLQPQTETDNLNSKIASPGTSLELRGNVDHVEEEASSIASDSSANPALKIRTEQLERLTSESQKRADIRYADLLSELDGYSPQALEAIRLSLIEAETELRFLFQSIDYTSPSIKEELRAAVETIERRKRERLEALMTEQDISRFDTYVASLTFREKLPEIRSQMKARQRHLSEEKAAAVARSYEESITKYQAALESDSQQSEDSSSNDLSSFDKLFLEEVASILEEDTFTAFTDLYLDYQYE